MQFQERESYRELLQRSKLGEGIYLKPAVAFNTARLNDSTHMSYSLKMLVAETPHYLLLIYLGV